MKIGQYLFSPKGKINRKEYGRSFLLASIIALILFFGPTVMAYHPHIASFYNISKLLTALCNVNVIVLVLYSTIICLGLKRQRDIGISPWWVLISFVPFGNLLKILLFFYPGKKQNAATLPWH